MQPAPRNQQSAETMDELRALNARFIHNFVTNDVASHDAILHPCFINIWPTGQRWDRATYLKYWATAFDPNVIVYWDVRDELITVVGDVALVRSTNKHTRRRDGNEVTGMTMYTDTYLFENGAWKCIQAQLTTVAPEHYPADDTIVSVYIEGKRRERVRDEQLHRRAGGNSIVDRNVDEFARCLGSEHSRDHSALAGARTLPARPAARSERDLQDMGTCWSSIASEISKPFGAPDRPRRGRCLQPAKPEDGYFRGSPRRRTYCGHAQIDANDLKAGMPGVPRLVPKDIHRPSGMISSAATGSLGGA